MYHRSSPYILKGYKGISKTLSTSLYWNLARIIDIYRFSADCDTSRIQEIRAPKVLYWSINQYDT